MVKHNAGSVAQQCSQELLAKPPNFPNHQIAFLHNQPVEYTVKKPL